MFVHLPLFIGLRYIRSKKRNKFISIISAISFLGISLGISVVITVMSIMNGFDQEVKNKLLMMMPPLKVYPLITEIEDWSSLSKKIKDKIPIITNTAPIIESQGLLNSNTSNTSAFVKIQGIEPKYQNKVIPISKHIINGKLSSLDCNEEGYNIILGKILANNLGVKIGDKVTLIISKINLTPAGIIPIIKQFKVSGIFSTSYQYDAYYALINIKKAQKIFKTGNSVSSIQLAIGNIYNAPIVKEKLNNILSHYYITYDWTDENKSFFDALKMEKTMTFFILLLIIAVAIFNLLSSLIMIVIDKRSDIAILRTMGMSSKQIIAIFMYQGLIVGLIGTIIGVLLGIILSTYTTTIFNFIQNITGKQFLNTSIYIIDYIPSKLMWLDVFKITLISIFLSFLATIYPAWNASKIEPIESLKYE